MTQEAIPPDGPKVKARGKWKSEVPVCWQSRLALDRIVNELGTQAALGISVYVTLCRFSSKEQNNPAVQVDVSKIAHASGLGYRKTFDILHDLAGKAKVISITAGERKGAKQPANIYTLLSFARLHKGKSQRLHIVQSSDCTRSTSSRAENPKDSHVVRESINSQLPTAGSDLASPSDQLGAEEMEGQF